MKARKRGLSFVDMVIIILTLIVIVFLVIPVLMRLGQKAKEDFLKGNLNQLRVGIDKFKDDCGDYPLELKQLVRKPEEGSIGPNHIKLIVKNWNGPYLRSEEGNLPKDPFSERDFPTAHSIINGDWDYRDPKTGDVHSYSNETATDGSYYSRW